MNAEKSTALDQAPSEMNSPESGVPLPNPLDDSSSDFLISDTITDCDGSDESLSDSDDSRSECDFDKYDC